MSSIHRVAASANVRGTPLSLSLVRPPRADVMTSRWRTSGNTALPVAVFTWSTPWSTPIRVAVRISSSVRKPTSMITLDNAPPSRARSANIAISRSTRARSPLFRAPMLMTMSRAVPPTSRASWISASLTRVVCVP